MTEKLLTYGLGRGLEYYDQPAVRSILRETAANEYRMRDLIQAVVMSTPFQMRRPQTNDDYQETPAPAHFLRGTGTALALPFLDAMVPAFGGTTNATARSCAWASSTSRTESSRPVGSPRARARLRVQRHHEGAGPYRDRTLVLSNLAQIKAVRWATAQATMPARARPGSPACIPRRRRARTFIPEFPPTRSRRANCRQAHPVRFARNRCGGSEPGRRVRFRL